MEYIKKYPQKRITTILFDFDGTISSLRSGWESVMENLMIECISGDTLPDEVLVRDIRRYIGESTGIQTIFQMKWLCEAVSIYGRNKRKKDNSRPFSEILWPESDPWIYKDEYNRRLMATVDRRRREVMENPVQAEKYLIKGSTELLQKLKSLGVEMFVASGTDETDVQAEAAILGLAEYFSEIKGALPRTESCSKEAVIRSLISGKSVKGDNLCVIGDGKVEIAIGCENGARTLGLASDEAKRSGVNTVKRERLILAGADVICGDFTELGEIIEFLGY